MINQLQHLATPGSSRTSMTYKVARQIQTSAWRDNAPRAGIRSAYAGAEECSADVLLPDRAPPHEQPAEAQQRSAGAQRFGDDERRVSVRLELEIRAGRTVDRADVGHDAWRRAGCDAREQSRRICLAERGN